MDVKQSMNDFDKDEYSVSSEKAAKKYIVEPASLNSSLYQVRVEGGGSVPVRLQGKFTSSAKALTEVKLYLDAKPKTKVQERNEKTARRENAKI